MKEKMKEGVKDIAPVEVAQNSNWKARPVNQFGLDGKYIQTFPSKKNACKVTGTDITSLNAAIKGKQKTAGGFQWRYAD